MNKLANKYTDAKEQMNYILYNEKKVPKGKIFELQKQNSLAVFDKTGKR